MMKKLKIFILKILLNIVYKVGGFKSYGFKYDSEIGKHVISFYKDTNEFVEDIGLMPIREIDDVSILINEYRDTWVEFLKRIEDIRCAK